MGTGEDSKGSNRYIYSVRSHMASRLCPHHMDGGDFTGNNTECLTGADSGQCVWGVPCS
jgi:hypothetical protein